MPPVINLALQFDLQAQEMAQKKYGDRELWGKKEKIQFSSLKEVCVLLAESSQTYQGGAVPAPISSAPHSTHALPLGSPWVSRSQSKWGMETDGFASRPLLVHSALRSLMELRSVELLLLSSAA